MVAGIDWGCSGIGWGCSGTCSSGIDVQWACSATGTELKLEDEDADEWASVLSLGGMYASCDGSPRHCSGTTR